MKKWLLIMICVSMLLGCNSPIGSFQDGTMDMNQLYKRIMVKCTDAKWKFKPLQDTNWSNKQIEAMYHLDMTKIKEGVVRSSVMEFDMNEIAIFKVSEKNEHYVKGAIENRMHELSSSWALYNQDAQDILEESKQGRIGQYYYFILGEDSKKVVNYIRNQE